MGKRNWHPMPETTSMPQSGTVSVPATVGVQAMPIACVTWTSSDGTVYKGKVINQKTILEVELPDKTVIGVNAADVKSC